MTEKGVVMHCGQCGMHRTRNPDAPGAKRLTRASSDQPAAAMIKVGSASEKLPSI